MSSKPAGFPRVISEDCGRQKAAGIRRLFMGLSADARRRLLEPLGAAPVAIPIMAPIPVAAPHVALKAAVHPSAMFAMMRQDGKPALLAVVDRLVERARRVCGGAQAGRGRGR